MSAPRMWRPAGLTGSAASALTVELPQNWSPEDVTPNTIELLLHSKALALIEDAGLEEVSRVARSMAVDSWLLNDEDAGALASSLVGHWLMQEHIAAVRWQESPAPPEDEDEAYGPIEPESRWALVEALSLATLE